ncbi:hypothetical protein ACKWTF_004680 [Chironomus riparius]
MSDLVDPTPFYLKKRYLIIFLIFIGYINLYTMRVNMSVAIVALTQNRTIIGVDGTKSYEQHFDWSSQQKGFALGAFFYGYIMTQFAGGVLATKFGGQWVFGLGIFGTAVMTLFTPLMTYQGITYLIISRVIQGVFSGMAFPAVNAVYAVWSPPLERSRSASYGISGIYVGTIIANLLSGWLGDNYGWEWIFYVFGAATIVWNVLWFLLVHSSPEHDPWITEGEKKFISESLKNQSGMKNVVKPPWKAIFTSYRVYAIAIAHFSYNWGYYTLLTQLPMYMRDILKNDLTKSGILSAVPYIVQTILIFITGYLADWLLVKKILTVTQVRKYFNNIALLGQMTFLLIAAFLTNTSAIIVCISLSVGLGALAMSGYLPNTIDIAPQFGSIILGLSNTFATIPGLVSPVLSGFIAVTPSADEYRIIFYITCGIYIVGAVVYGIFATAKVQPWALTEHSSTESTTRNDKETKNV